MNLGINKESFELYFTENWATKDTWLSTGMDCYWYPIWYLRILGFKYLFQLLVLENPVQDKDYYKYKVRMQKKYLYWFNWKVKEFKIK